MNTSWATGVLLSAAIGLAAHRASALTLGGAISAIGVGSAVHAGTGWRGSTALVTYFATSSFLGRLPGDSGRAQHRGNQRDSIQVLANGGPSALLAGVAHVCSNPIKAHALAGYFGAVAAATADTWSTEVGSRFGGEPRSIKTLDRLPAGTSGGVSSAGLAASFAGAALIAAIAGGRSADGDAEALSLSAAVGGIAGSLVDSVLGATIQSVRLCEKCGEETELPTHHCGATTFHARGWAWCDNDAVNALSITTGALTSIVAFAMHNRQLRVLRDHRQHARDWPRPVDLTSREWLDPWRPRAGGE